MKKCDLMDYIAKVASRYGFEVKDGYGLCGFMIVDETNTVNFRLNEETEADYDKRTATIQITASASIATMGGNPTTEDLLRAAEIITKAATLVDFLNAKELSFTETW